MPDERPQGHQASQDEAVGRGAPDGGGCAPIRDRRCHRARPRGDRRPLPRLSDTHTEGDFRCALLGHAGFDPARIEREVRRVRALAEGRLVRDPPRWSFKVLGEMPHGPYSSRENALRDADGRKHTMRRTTRIRRAP